MVKMCHREWKKEKDEAGKVVGDEKIKNFKESEEY